MSRQDRAAVEAETKVNFTAKDAFTVWLETNSVEPAVIYPVWPASPDIRCVGVDEPDEDAPCMFVPRAHEQVYALRRPGRLWFFIPLDRLKADTDFDDQ